MNIHFKLKDLVLELFPKFIVMGNCMEFKLQNTEFIIDKFNLDCYFATASYASMYWLFENDPLLRYQYTEFMEQYEGLRRIARISAI